mgnify:CR=1 FL=1
MTWQDRYITFFKKIPSPFHLAIYLSVLALLLSFLCTEASIGDVSVAWTKGFWELLPFGMQMLLILVLGSALAESRVAQILIDEIANRITSGRQAVFWMSVFALLSGYLNWGLSLVFSALLAKKISQSLTERKIKYNHGLLVASAYLGLMVWHGGLSGSAPLDVASTAHKLVDKIGTVNTRETLASNMNLFSLACCLLFLPLVSFLFSKRQGAQQNAIIQVEEDRKYRSVKGLPVGRIFALLMLFFFVISFWHMQSSILSLNNINMILFITALALHGHLAIFMASVQKGLGNAVGIVLQFPIYAGLMGLLKYTGLLSEISAAILQIADVSNFYFLSFLSAGLTNILVPSGGGQWQVQGPILIEVAQQLGLSIPKTVMALAYGDQLTNMLQPFWALPLLGITKAKVSDILPYTLVFMMVGFLIFTAALYIF